MNESPGSQSGRFLAAKNRKERKKDEDTMAACSFTHQTVGLRERE